jgi:hypothetical protein
VEKPDDRNVSVWALRCLECDRSWDDASERWRLYLTHDATPEPAIYCPACARREFED